MTETSDPVYERVASELARKLTSWATLGRDIGVAKGAMGNWASRGIPSKHYSPIAIFLGVRIEWLIGTDDRKHEDGSSFNASAARPVNTLAQALQAVADAVHGLDSTSRELVANLLPRLVLRPDSSAEVAALISRLTTTQERTEPIATAHPDVPTLASVRAKRPEPLASRFVTTRPPAAARAKRTTGK